MGVSHQRKSTKEKFLCPSEDGASVFGEPARILANGGRFDAERCNCSHKGQACYHTFRWMTFHLYRLNWSADDALTYSTSPAFAWANPTEEDPFKSTPDAIRERWDELHAAQNVDQDVPRAWRLLLSRTKRHPRTKRFKADSTILFHWIDEAARRLLTHVRFNINSGRRALQRAMADMYGWRKGTTDFYLRECTERGYLICEKASKRGLADKYKAHSSSADLYAKHAHPKDITPCSGPRWSIGTPPLEHPIETPTTGFRVPFKRFFGHTHKAVIGCDQST